MSGLIARQGGLAIGFGTRVTLHFAIHLASGEEVDTTRRGRAATFTVGDGNLPGGFERALFGLRAGADERLPIPVDEAFGPRREGNIRTLRRADFANAGDLAPGTIIAFAAAAVTGESATGESSASGESPPSGEAPPMDASLGAGELPGVVLSVAQDTVVVDFNHPLAGRELVFDVTILGVEPA